MQKDLHCPTCGRSMQQRSSKIFNTFRPMAIQDHRPSIPSIGTSVRKRRSMGNEKDGEKFKFE